MDSRGKSMSERSLCERSMKVVSNIIRISSFSIAQRSLGVKSSGKGTSSNSKDMMNLEEKEEEEEEEENGMLLEMKEPALMVSEFRGGISKRSQEPQNKPKRTYVIKPSGRDNEATSIISHHHHHHHHMIHNNDKETTWEAMQACVSTTRVYSSYQCSAG
ncbi:hypothetical protein G2W53_006876 [Senna tora]|uniref:Uncharacterized protein n=1 Tax=Senna tora TaxID=362788 RepID=A0A835CDL0_9FABA|nr:hypothetical protein G2W53_006876 [Senna tora]